VLEKLYILSSDASNWGSRLGDKKLVGRSVAIALGIICMILTLGLVVLVAHYVLVMSEKDTTISLQDSQIAGLQSGLDGNKTKYEDQLANESRQIADREAVIADLNATVLSLNSTISHLASIFLNMTVNATATYTTVNEFANDPRSWVNRTIMVEGNLTFIAPYRSIEEFANGYFWNYEISSNGTFGLNWAPDNWDRPPSYDGVNAIVIGILRATTVYNPTVYNSPSYQTAYYIEAEKIVPL
jgi:hypothetical protein